MSDRIAVIHAVGDAFVLQEVDWKHTQGHRHLVEFLLPGEDFGLPAVDSFGSPFRCAHGCPDAEVLALRQVARDHRHEDIGNTVGGVEEIVVRPRPHVFDEACVDRRGIDALAVLAFQVGELDAHILEIAQRQNGKVERLVFTRRGEGAHRGIDLRAERGGIRPDVRNVAAGVGDQPAIKFFLGEFRHGVLFLMLGLGPFGQLLFGQQVNILLVACEFFALHRIPLRRRHDGHAIDEPSVAGVDLKIKHAIGDDIHRQHTRVVFTGEGGADFTLAAGDTSIPHDIAVRAARSSPAGRAEQDPDFVGSLGCRDAESGCGISGDMILAQRVEEDRKLLKRIRHARLFWILADLHLDQISLLDGGECRFVYPAKSGLGRPGGVRRDGGEALGKL